MKKIFDLYGIETDDLDLCRETVQSALGVQLTPHVSSYIGGYYRWGRPYGEELVLQKNFNEVDQEFCEERFKHAKTLLYVNQPSDPDKIRRQLEACSGRISFLERKEL